MHYTQDKTFYFEFRSPQTRISDRQRRSIIIIYYIIDTENPFGVPLYFLYLFQCNYSNDIKIAHNVFWIINERAQFY